MNTTEMRMKYLFNEQQFVNYSNCIKGVGTTACNFGSATTIAEQQQNSTTFEDIVFVVYYYGVLIVLSVVNIVGNTIVITGVLRHSSIRVPGNYFIISLALSDICLGLAYPLYNVSHVEFVEVMASTVGTWSFCTILTTLTLSFLSISSFNLVGLTTVRFLSIKNPLRYTVTVTHTRSLLAVIAVWFLLFTLTAGIFLRPSTPDVDYTGLCRYELFLSGRHMVFTTTVSFLVPIVIMTPMYIYMALQARRQARQIADIEKVKYRNSKENIKHIPKREMRMFKVAAVLLGYFTFVWIPYIVYGFITISCSCEVNKYLRATVQMILHSNSSANLAIYAGRIKEVRELLKQDCLAIFCYCKKGPIITHVQSLIPDTVPPKNNNDIGKYPRGVDSLSAEPDLVVNNISNTSQPLCVERLNGEIVSV